MPTILDIRSGRTWHPGRAAVADNPLLIDVELRSPRFMAPYLDCVVAALARRLDQGDIRTAREQVEHLRFVVADYAEAHGLPRPKGAE